MIRTRAGRSLALRTDRADRRRAGRRIAPEALLALLRSKADDEGLATASLRRLAEDLGATTTAVRAATRSLADAGRIAVLGRGVYALRGTMAMPPHEEEPALPRTPPHEALHDSGGTLRW